MILIPVGRKYVSRPLPQNIVATFTGLTGPDAVGPPRYV
jgi:hypothetical protein